jgi:hypothetical protein
MQAEMQGMICMLPQPFTDAILPGIETAKHVANVD